MKKLVGLGITVALLVALVSVVIATHHPGSIHIIGDYPKTINDAIAEGYFVTPFCVPGMGIHAIKFGASGVEFPILLYETGKKGELVGVEFMTRFYGIPLDIAEIPFEAEYGDLLDIDDDTGGALNSFLVDAYGIDLTDPMTWPVPVPTWHGPMGPHDPLMGNTMHWDLHIYFEDPTNACED